MDFWYDGQVRRYILQFMRIFSDIKIKNGPDSNGLYTVERIPIVYGDASSMVSHILKGVSENTMLPVPIMSAYVSELDMDSSRRNDPMFVSKVSTIERKYNKITNSYENGPGIRQDIERYMPVPYKLSMNLDVWTSNITNKLQIFEQLAVIFNPTLQLQQNTNVLDWTSIFEIELIKVKWTSRNIPATDEARDILSYTFTIPIWINPPAKLKRSSLIAEIVSNVFSGSETQTMAANLSTYDPFRTLEQSPVQIITTEGNYKIEVAKGVQFDEIKLLNSNGVVSSVAIWDDLIQKYGQIDQTITKLRLKLNNLLDDSNYDIIGSIVQDADRRNILLFTPDIDTLPQNTLQPITAIIDPSELSPGNGLPTATIGQRYLLTSQYATTGELAIPINLEGTPWGNIIAYENDIIVFTGNKWEVIFDSRSSTTKQYVVNNENSCQYMFDGNMWTYSYYGIYDPGLWRIDNIITSQVV